MVNIPVEIWSNCWSNLSKPELISLSMTCRLFHDICRPQVFEHLMYFPPSAVLTVTVLLAQHVTDKDYRDWKSDDTHFEGKLKWLASNPISARYPRLCMFSGIAQEDLQSLDLQRPNAGHAYYSLLSTFKASLRSFTNLREIHLEDIDVDEETVQGLQRLPLLKRIRFECVDFSCHSTSTLIHMKDLHIMDWDPQNRATPRLLQLFSNQGLKFLELQTHRHALPCLQHFILHGRSETLTELKLILDVGIIPTLFAFLETCPHLTMLVATKHSSLVFNPTFPALSSSALPELGCYEGVANLAAVLVPGRPVYSIILEDTWDGNITDVHASSILYKLTKSLAVIKTLSLPCMAPHSDIFHAVSKKFPNLGTLHLNFSMTDADLLEFTDDDEVPDEEYLDVTIPTEIISIPVDGDGCPVRLPTSMKGEVYWLCLNKLPLPATITELVIFQHKHLRGHFRQLYKSCLTFGEQYQILGMLSLHSPNLRIVTFGGRGLNWVMDDNGKWEPGRDLQFYVKHRSEILANAGTGP